MRKSDIHGLPCPETLGEYRLVCEAVAHMLGYKKTKAVKLMDELIAKAPQGENAVVLAPDSQMRALLIPVLLEKADD